MQEITRPIFVLGMYRSGTSLVAELVHRWGAYGGDPAQLRKADERNPRGYWESGELDRFCRELFKTGPQSLWHPGFRSNLLARAAEPEWQEKGRALLAAMSHGGRTWFWKEPFLSLFLPFWARILDDVTYVVTVRNPYESAVSWQKFLLPADESVAGRVSIVAANLLRWQHLMLETLEHAHGGRTLFVSYESLIQDAGPQVSRLAGFLDDQYSLSHDEARIASMQSVVEPSLWHDKAGASFDEVVEATSEQKALYRFLQARAEDQEISYDPSLYPLYAGWREYLMNIDLFLEYYRSSRRTLGSLPVRALLAVGRPVRLLRGAWGQIRQRRQVQVARGTS